ncbi:MAG: DUF6875 domain-containing protein [Chloroflexota bacterium]
MKNDIGLLTPERIEDAQNVVNWAKHTICSSHPDLGRAGPVCPFVPPSLKRNSFYLALHYEIDGQNKGEIISLIQSYIKSFRHYLSTGAKDALYNTILVVFPNVLKENAPIVDQIAKELKTSVVQLGLMLGEFHPNSKIDSIRNPNFHPMVSPYPMLVIRNMAVHDILFLHQQQSWFEEYNKRFGEQYQRNRVSNEHGLVDLYYSSLKKFGRQVRLSSTQKHPSVTRLTSDPQKSSQSIAKRISK